MIEDSNHRSYETFTGLATISKDNELEAKQKREEYEASVESTLARFKDC